MRVLGIDPGSHVTGYGVVERQRSGLVSVVFGEIRPPRQGALSVCLQAIHGRLQEVIREILPDAIAIEDIFFGKNVKSLIRQGQVRGVAILAGAQEGVPLFEYTPLEIKKAVVGYGRAEKAQVQQMVRAILGLADLAPPDASDALAVAICHANHLKGHSI